jgi:hypothetical protein
MTGTFIGLAVLCIVSVIIGVIIDKRDTDDSWMGDEKEEK